eukprot:SAG31_NODE_5074_length_2760_cov_1.463360_1_plen_72_part_00
MADSAAVASPLAAVVMQKIAELFWDRICRFYRTAGGGNRGRKAVRDASISTAPRDDFAPTVRSFLTFRSRL